MILSMWINAKMTAQIIALMHCKNVRQGVRISSGMILIILIRTKTKETICVSLFSKEQFLLHLTKNEFSSAPY